MLVEARIAAVKFSKLLLLLIRDKVLVIVTIIIVVILISCARPCTLCSRLNSSVTSSLALSVTSAFLRCSRTLPNFCNLVL
jgi:hypothetical protein